MKTRKPYWKGNLWELRCTACSLQVFRVVWAHLFFFSFSSFFFFQVKKKNFEGVYQCNLFPIWIKKTENHKSDIPGEKKISLFITRVNECVQFWVGILDLMLVLLIGQEQALTDINTDVSFLHLSFSILSTIHTYTNHILHMLWCISCTFCFSLCSQSSRCPIKYKPCWLSALSS